MRKILLSLFFLCNALYMLAQPAYVPGSHNGWGHNADSETILKQNLGGVPYYGITFKINENDGFKITKTNNWAIQWAGVTIPGTTGINIVREIGVGGGDITLSGANYTSAMKGYLHLCIKNPAGSAGQSLSVGCMTLSAEPVNISQVSNTATVTQGDIKTINATLSAAPSPEEKFFLRYTNDGWASSELVEMTTSGTTASHNLTFSKTGTYNYYVFSSTVSLANLKAASDKDILTINYNNNGGSNYSTSVGTIDAATAFTATKANHEQVNLAWIKNAKANDVVIFARIGSAPSDPVQGTAYTLNSGDETTAAGKVVYKGAATSHAVTALQANTQYFFKAVAANNNYYSTVVAANATTDQLSESVTIAATLTEENLSGASVNISLSNVSFADATLLKSNFSLSGAPKGTTISAINYTSATGASVQLAFDGTDFDTDKTLFAIQIDAAELTGSANLTSNKITIAATDDAETLALAWHTTPGTNGLEASMNGEVIRATLSNGTFVSSELSTASVTASGTAFSSANVSVEAVSYVDAHTADIALAWDGTDYDTDKTLQLNFAASSIDDHSSTLQKSITLPATVEPKYTLSLTEANRSVLDPITIVFQDYDAVNDFYTNGQDFIFMHVGLDIDGDGAWKNTKSFEREADGTIDPTKNAKVKLNKIADGKYSATIDPVVFFQQIPSGAQVNGINIVFFNQYAYATNNKTEDLYIDLRDETYHTIQIFPSTPTANEPVRVEFNAKGTALATASKVYFHSGIATDAPNSKSFSIAVGNWGQDDGVGKMTAIAGKEGMWKIEFTSIANYFSMPTATNAFVLNGLFRSADGSTKVDGVDNYHLPLNPGNYVLLNEPSFQPAVVEAGVKFDVKAEANSATSWTLVETDANYTQEIGVIHTVSATAQYSYKHQIDDTNTHFYKLKADFGGGDIRFKTFSTTGYSSVVSAVKPANTIPGINYYADDNTKATLVLHTPTSTQYKKGNGTVSGTAPTPQKSIVHLIGTMNNWQIEEAYKLKKDGDYWWITLENLDPEKGYVFQYLVDGNMRIADPFSQQISEGNDKWISDSTYPNLVEYPSNKTSGIASVLTTKKQQYEWKSTSFTRPSSNELNIYELHFRDFTTEGTYKAATQKLDYLEELGINCIHVMPVSEFEGNDSWGYNPNFYFALDKAYGTKNDLKQFIDEAHARGIAVVNDLVLNHAFYSNTMARLYWDDANNRPAANNPWFNAQHKAVYDSNGHWGADWNHESEHTQNLMDRVLDFWLTEFKFDGFRFDFTKGLTQTAPDQGDPWASSYDQDRVDLLKRMVDAMWAKHPGSYAIFEHLANDSEDKALADHGILMWSGAGPQEPYKNLALGWSGKADYSMWGSVYSSRNFTYANYISYIESHDEERLGYDVFQYAKHVKDLSGEAQVEAAIDRLKLISAFNAVLPGPRMIWQFEELGYDVSINENGRTGRKPVRWEYFENTHRKELYRLYSLLFHLRKNYSLYENVDYGSIGWNDLSTVRNMKLSDNNGNQVIILGNFDPDNSTNTSPGFSETGTWYTYNGSTTLDGTSLDVTNTNQSITLEASQVLILTNFNAKLRPQTISWPAIAEQTYGTTITLAATTNSGLPIRYEVIGGNATVNGDKLTINGTDDVSVRALQDGGEYYSAASSVERTFSVAKAEQQISFTLASTALLAEASIELQATSSAKLPVSFTSSDTKIASINGTTLTLHKVGAVTISALQTGNDNYNAAQTVTQTLEVKAEPVKAEQQISFTLASPVLMTEGSVELQATSSANLPVSFTSSDANIASVDGATLTLHKAGTVNITAMQSGNENYKAANTVSQTLVINKADQQITFALVPSVFLSEESLELQATSTANLPVVFASSDVSVASINGTTLTLHKAGTVDISAAQLGNNTYNAAQTVVHTIQVKVTTGIELATASVVKIYPNPTSSTLRLQGQYQHGTITVYSLAGNRIQLPSSKTNEVDVRTLPQGQYILSVVVNGKTQSLRFVKQ